MTLHYTGEAVLMANDVCQALLRYAQALAATQGSDVVTVPVIAEDGSPAHAEFLLGPASQLYATSAPDRPHQSDNADTVSELNRRMRMLHPVALVGPIDSEFGPEVDPSDEWS